jgi:hypothetical protein
MRAILQQSARVLTSCVLIAIFAIPPSLLAQSHVVSPGDIQRQVLEASQVRQRNIEVLRGLFSSPEGVKALQSAHVDVARVNNAVASLSDAELADLASRAQQSQANFAAGDLSTRDLLFIIIGVAVLILIIVAVR